MVLSLLCKPAVIMHKGREKLRFSTALHFHRKWAHVTNPSFNSDWAPTVCQALSWEVHRQRRKDVSGRAEEETEKQNRARWAKRCNRRADPGQNWLNADFQKQRTGISQVVEKDDTDRGCHQPRRPRGDRESHTRAGTTWRSLQLEHKEEHKTRS